MFEIFPGKSGKWYWRFRAVNGNITADGSYGYATKGGVVRATKAVCESMRSLPFPSYITLKGEHGVKAVKE